MNNIDEMWSICHDCPYWEVCDPPYICEITEEKIKKDKENWRDRLTILEKQLENEVAEGKITEEEANDQYSKAYAKEYCKANYFL